MRILISNFIINLIKWFFSVYRRVTYAYTIPGTATRVGVTYYFAYLQVDANNIVKLYLTSSCTGLVRAGSNPLICFNPTADCDGYAQCVLPIQQIQYVEYAAVPANQTTLVIQIRLPPDIT
jgi:hypothetical protein